MCVCVRARARAFVHGCLFLYTLSFYICSQSLSCWFYLQSGHRYGRWHGCFVIIKHWILSIAQLESLLVALGCILLTYALKSILVELSIISKPNKWPRNSPQKFYYWLCKGILSPCWDGLIMLLLNLNLSQLEMKNAIIHDDIGKRIFCKVVQTNWYERGEGVYGFWKKLRDEWK